MAIGVKKSLQFSLLVWDSVQTENLTAKTLSNYVRTFFDSYVQKSHPTDYYCFQSDVCRSERGIIFSGFVAYVCTRDLTKKNTHEKNEIDRLTSIVRKVAGTVLYVAVTDSLFHDLRRPGGMMIDVLVTTCWHCCLLLAHA